MTDKLDMNAINSLEGPLQARFCGDTWIWPIYDIDVETGLMRIDVSGKTDIKHYSELAEIRDVSGATYDPDIFWLE